MRLLSLLILLIAMPAAAQQVDIAKLCAELADPAYAPVSADGKLNLPKGMDRALRGKFEDYLFVRVALLFALRNVQVGQEAEAQLNLLELGFKDEKLPPALEKVRKKIRDDTQAMRANAESVANTMKDQYRELCPSSTGPTNITLQPIPGLLLPGVALTGVVAAPLPPSPPPGPEVPTELPGPEASPGPTELVLEVAGIKENVKLKWADGKWSITDITREGIPWRDPKAVKFSSTRPTKITQSVEGKVTLNEPLPKPWTLWLGVSPGDKKIGQLCGPSITSCSLKRGPNPRGPGWAAAESFEAWICSGQTLCGVDPVAAIDINWQLP